MAEIIVEIGNMHEGSLGIAFGFIDMVAASGAEIVKFQMHLSEFEGTADEPFRVNFSKQDRTRKEYWDRVNFTDDGWREISDYAEGKGLEFMCTPFSIEAAKKLMRFTSVKRWKVGSGDAVNFPLIDFLAQTELPLIISTGLVSWEEIVLLKERLKRLGAWNRTTLMHCVSEYPTPIEHSSLDLIDRLSTLGCRVGLSDHSGNQWVPAFGLTKGITLLEIHFTPDRNFFGPDVTSSLLPDEIANLVEFNKIVSRLEGGGLSKEELYLNAEQTRYLFRKGIYWATDMSVGDVCNIENISFLKPLMGIDSMDFESILGKKVTRAVIASSPVHLEDFGLR